MGFLLRNEEESEDVSLARAKIAGTLCPVNLFLKESGDTWIRSNRLPRRGGDYKWTAGGWASTSAIGLSEWGLACAIKRLSRGNPTSCNVKPDLDGLGQGQKKAVDLILDAAVSVVTGGPGTGKTTCVRRAVDALRADGQNVVQLAPTGMASRRLAQATGHDAYTAHSWLGKVERGEIEPESVDSLVLDEGSMMGVELSNKVLAVLADGCRVVIMGDPKQLPSVDTGNFLCDLIDSRMVPVAALKEIFRYEAGGPIAAACEAVLEGQIPPSASKGGVGFHLISKKAGRMAECTAHAMKLLKIDIYKCRTLCATRQDSWITNEQIKRQFNPRPAYVDSRDFKNPLWYTRGDPVRQRRNDWKIGIVNGDTGKYGETQGYRYVDFGGLTVPYKKCDIALAYASTIHSAQGCEYPYVGVYITRRSGNLLTRELLNTAISRSQQLCLTIVERDHLQEILARRTPRRSTRLREFLRNEDHIWDS